MHDPSIETAADIPTAPDEDGIPVERQRAERLGPDYDPDYFTKLDRLIEEHYGAIFEYVPKQLPE